MPITRRVGHGARAVNNAMAVYQCVAGVTHTTVSHVTLAEAVARWVDKNAGFVADAVVIYQYVSWVAGASSGIWAAHAVSAVARRISVLAPWFRAKTSLAPPIFITFAEICRRRFACRDTRAVIAACIFFKIAGPDSAVAFWLYNTFVVYISPAAVVADAFAVAESGVCANAVAAAGWVSCEAAPFAEIFAVVVAGADAVFRAGAFWVCRVAEMDRR